MITENMVTVRFNLFAIFIAEAATLLPAVMFIIGLWRDVTNTTPNYSVGIIGMIIIVLFTIAFIASWIILTFSVFPSFKIIFSETGIQKRATISLFSVNLYASNIEIKWENIAELKWVYMGHLSGYHIIGKDNQGKDMFLILSIFSSKRNKALRFAVEHLPKSKVSGKLLKKLGY